LPPAAGRDRNFALPLIVAGIHSPLLVSVPPGQEVQVQVTLLVMAKGIKTLCKYRNLTLEVEDFGEI